MDSIWVRKGAENYAGFTSPEVTVTRSGADKAAKQEDRAELFRRFPSRAAVPQGVATDFSGLAFTYRRERITVTKAGRVILTESLPSAFYYSGLQVASVRFQGSPCLLISTYSRASTGRVWLGLYRADGSRLHTATVPRREIWEVIPSSEGFTLAGASGSTKIALRPHP